jgi:hypothetical protein
MNITKKNEANIVALDTHGDTKGEIYNADDTRLQQMGSSYLSIHANTD